MFAGQQGQVQGRGARMASIDISTSLPLGRGSLSCDIVVLRRTGADSDKLLYLMATNNPAGVELYHSPEHAFSQVDMPCENIAAAIMWANKDYKAVHIISNSSLVNAACDSAMELQYLLRGMVSDKGLHPPASATARPRRTCTAPPWWPSRTCQTGTGTDRAGSATAGCSGYTSRMASCLHRYRWTRPSTT